MNKIFRSLTKPRLISVISMGVIVLGMVWIGWALTNIEGDALAYKEAAPLQSISPTGISSPDKILYASIPAVGDAIGTLSIPVLDCNIPIIHGTGENELKKGAGHFMQSVLPGMNDNCVISGHRSTVFAKLGKLKLDDQLIIQTSAGTFTYIVKGIRIVDKDDKTVIVPTDHAVLTLTTCYPFIYVGNAPYRYIVTADLEMANTTNVRSKDEIDMISK